MVKKVFYARSPHGWLPRSLTAHTETFLNCLTLGTFAEQKPQKIMANVEFPDYMKGVSGTLKTITLNDGTKRKVIVTCSKSGKQRLYIRDYQPRSTKVSEKEQKQRDLFANATLFYNNLTEEQKKDFYKQWKKNKYCLNGKKYVTLRGYIVASFIKSKS